MLHTSDHRGNTTRHALAFASALTSLALTLGIAGCGPDGPDVVGGVAVDVDSDDVALGPGDTVRVTATEFEFSPDDFVAVPGSYSGELVNEGVVLHNLTFSDGRSFPVSPGETVAIDFVVPDGGLTFVCSIEGHEAAGMRGEVHTSENDDDS